MAAAIPPGTERERAYIDAIVVFYRDAGKRDHKSRALAYEQSMARVAARFPGDHEAAIFHALAILGNSPITDKTFAGQKRAAAILNGLLPLEPEHPGITHYLIHAYDYPQLAELALDGARAYAKIAPDSPHALHMPSHIFTRLGMWDESIASNLESARVARELVGRHHPGAESFDALHALDYLEYAYLQTAQDEKARAVVAEIARVDKLDEQRRLPVGAVRDQRIVDVELLGNTMRLEDALDPQHFLDLVLHRHPVLEAESDVWPAGHRAALLVRDDARPQLGPFARVTLEAEQVRGPQLLVWCA